MVMWLLLGLLVGMWVAGARGECSHQWTTERVPRLLALASDYRAICDTVERLRSFRRVTPDSVQWGLKCARCGHFEPMYGYRTPAALWFDSVNAVLDSVRMSVDSVNAVLDSVRAAQKGGVL